MADENPTPLSNSVSIDKNECTSPDDTPVSPLSPLSPLSPIHAGAPGFTYHQTNLMPDLLPNERLSDNPILELLQEFVRKFTERYPTSGPRSGPTLFMGSLDEALAHSFYNQQDAHPLILFIYHGRSVSTNIFCTQVLCKNEITNYINENFIVWAWDRTSENNYQQLLEMLRTHLGNEIEETVTLSPIDAYPMLICVMFNNGGVEIANTIKGYESPDDTLDFLMEARYKFDCRIETPHPGDRLCQPVLNDVWSMSPSVLKPIERTSEEFERIASQFVGQTEQVIQIDKIENLSWFSQYLDQKRAIRNHCLNNQFEQILVFSCSQVNAEYILRNGFNNDHEARAHSHGFRFLSPAVYKNCYLPSNPANGSPQAILVCRVLVDRTSLISDGMVETCPNGCDLTTDGHDTYIVYSNRSILPKYYIKY